MSMGKYEVISTLEALGTSDYFDNNLEGFNSMLKAMDKPWTVRHNEDEE